MRAIRKRRLDRLEIIITGGSGRQIATWVEFDDGRMQGPALYDPAAGLGGPAGPILSREQAEAEIALAEEAGMTVWRLHQSDFRL
jgi:hypothetical protein